MRCSSCGNEAVTFQEYSGKHLCRRHFCEDIEAKAKHAIRLHHWLRAGDHIGVALTGDEKSGALLFFLHALVSRRRDVRITAIAIDGVRDDQDLPGAVIRQAEMAGIPVINASSSDYFGIALKEILGNHGSEPSCIAATLRSILLDAAAREHGVTKIATAHSLDDEACAVLMSVMRGEPEEILACSPDIPRKSLPMIHPFIPVSDNDIRRYASLRGIGCTPPNPPRSAERGTGFSASIRTMLDGYTSRHPATKYSLMHLGENIRGAGIDCGKILETCVQCGEPIHTTCAGCRITDEVKGRGA